MSDGEIKAYKEVNRRQETNKVTTSMDVANKLERSRYQAYRILKSLIEKDLLEIYGGKYYKTKGTDNVNTKRKS